MLQCKRQGDKMLNINMEFRRGILFIRLNGSLDKNNIKRIIETDEFKYIVFNIEKLYAIDTHGINYLLKVNHLLKRKKGKLLICDKNSNNDFMFDEIPKINSELEAFTLCEVIR